jgi:hypothetical protein
MRGTCTIKHFLSLVSWMTLSWVVECRESSFEVVQARRPTRQDVKAILTYTHLLTTSLKQTINDLSG